MRPTDMTDATQAAAYPDEPFDRRMTDVSDALDEKAADVEGLAGRLEMRAKTMNGAEPVGAGDGHTYAVGYYGLIDRKLDRETATALRTQAAELAAVKAEIARLEDELSESRQTWPDWATKVYAFLRKLGYYEGSQDDIHLPDDLEEWFDETFDTILATSLATANAEIAGLRDALNALGFGKGILEEKIGWRGTYPKPSTDAHLRCEFCSAEHVNVDEIAHSDDCPVTVARRTQITPPAVGPSDSPIDGKERT